MGKRSVASSFFSGLGRGLAGTASQVGASYWQGRQLADQARKEKEREAVRVAERKQLMDIQAATQEAGQKDRRLGMMLRTLDPSVMGKGWLLSQQGDDALAAGMPGLIDEGRRLAKEAEGRDFWRRKELAKMRGGGGRFADASRKAPYASFQNATKTFESISRAHLQNIKSIDKQIENTFSPQGKVALQEQRSAIADQLKESNNSRMYNASLMSRALTGDIPSEDEFSRGVEMFLDSQGLDPGNARVFDSSSLTLLYARYRPEMLASKEEPKYRGVFGEKGIPERGLFSGGNK